MDDLYRELITAGTHKATSIKVAEAAKVIENAQRDLNIALMNELAMIFDRLEIRTRDVLDAAGTKWNFLKFAPGPVGGHCIGVDSYYLTAKAESVGFHPQVSLAGRRINDGMGTFIAQRLVKLLIERGRPVKDAKVGILGLTFKENVSDLRNSRVPDIVNELAEFGITPLVHDTLADPAETNREHGVHLADLGEFHALDALVLVVPHRQYLDMTAEGLCRVLGPHGILIDVKSVLNPVQIPTELRYWSV